MCYNNINLQIFGNSIYWLYGNVCLNFWQFHYYVYFQIVFLYYSNIEEEWKMLEEIQSAEKNAADMKDKMRAEGKKLLLDAKSKSKAVFAEVLNEAKKDAQVLKDNAINNAQEKVKEIKAQSTQQHDRLVQNAKQNQARAVQYVFSLLLN